MAQLGYNADPTDVGEPRGDYAPLTVGDKIMEAIACEIKIEDDGPNKGRQQVNWEFRVVEGPEAGRKHWEWVTIKNADGYTPPSSGDPARIGQQFNNSFAAAIGLVGEAATETDNYLFKPAKFYMKAKKPYRKRDGTEVTDGRQLGGQVKSVGGAKPTQGAQTGGGSSAGAATGSGKPKAYKDPESGKWHDEDGDVVPFFKLSGYEKVEG